MKASILGRRNPLMKLLALFVLVGGLTLVFDPVTPACFLAVAVVAGWSLGRVSPGRLVRATWPLWPAVVGIFVSNLLVGRAGAGATPLARLGPVEVTGPALETAGSLALRLLAMAAFSAVFVKTTDPADLVLSLVQQGRLSFRFAFGTLVGVRMLPLLRSEYMTIRAAHRVRGVREGRGVRGVWHRLRRYSLPLLTGAIRRAGRVALAMEARAFGAYPERTYRRRLVVSAADWLLLLASIALVGALIGGLRALGITRFGVGV